MTNPLVQTAGAQHARGFENYPNELVIFYHLFVFKQTKQVQNDDYQTCTP